MGHFPRLVRHGFRAGPFRFRCSILALPLFLAGVAITLLQPACASTPAGLSRTQRIYPLTTHLVRPLALCGCTRCDRRFSLFLARRERGRGGPFPESCQTKLGLYYSRQLQWHAVNGLPLFGSARREDLPSSLKHSGLSPLPACGHPLPMQWGEGRERGSR